MQGVVRTPSETLPLTPGVVGTGIGCVRMGAASRGVTGTGRQDSQVQQMRNTGGKGLSVWLTVRGGEKRKN